MIEELNFLNILIGIGSIIIIYFAWKSTSVQDRLPHTAVLVIENNRRRLLENIVRPQIGINHNSLARPIPIETQIQPTIDTLLASSLSLADVIEEVTDIANDYHRTSAHFNQTFQEEITELLEGDSDIGPQQIIQDMDNSDTAEGIRRRRLEYYNPTNSTEVRTEPPLRRENLNLQTDAQNYSNENNENENLSLNEDNKSDNPLLESPPFDHLPETVKKVTEFRIKLKYLNDDLRLVKGSPTELIGDFKKRHFTEELSSEKLVRLVFNGHVLQPDTKTLQNFGLFDNCVVHCLIHKKPSNSASEEPNIINSSTQLLNSNNRTNRRYGMENTNGPAFVYLCIAMVSFAIMFCWYCRIQYSSLFSLYSTVGLILITALFLIIFPLVILIERDVSTTAS